MLGFEETCWQSIREWLIAVGTVGAVLVALFWEPIRARWKRPKLDLSFDASSPDAITVNVDYPAAGPSKYAPSHWLRLNVSNRPRRRSAHEVRVLVTSVHRLGPDGTAVERLPLDTVALIWSNLKKASDVTEIPPGVDRRVDVANLIWATNQLPRDGATGCEAELQVIPEPSARRNRLAAGRYRLDLALSARDVDARRFSLLLKADGVWQSDAAAIGTHFTLEGLKSES